ncbi:EAL and HDOD domain-containing protein [Desulfobulbus alkaliphilus]|uniref:EAL and HDOD domain-containing protein n=1 Tax=Desulfobulbus alkaliphilus TaxID=869814 RepID=UPI0019645449|nr:HDOD domain-containing protein [Desulfobulbus alkaliphilus]MBM9536544.1 HDOD domain-containing protein [Desulfobulbus alkaliphilus]
MDIYIARQPVFNRKKQLFAYEVLYRSSIENTCPSSVLGDDATNTVLAHVLFNIGLETITGGRRALINFTENHLLQQTPTYLPREQCIIEILESILPTPDVLAACKILHGKGYILALDDYDFDETMDPLMPWVHIVKVDFLAVDKDSIRNGMARLKQFEAIRWLAEKIESHQEFDLAMSLGFSYFQGYFFNKPEVIKNKTLNSSKITLLNLLTEVCRPEINLKKIEKMITPDVSLSYKVLRYINSAYYSLVTKVTSIRYALLYLGESGVRQFVSLAAASEFSEGKPTELMRLSMVRAQLCKLLAEPRKDELDTSQLFLLGLFSLLDAMLDMPMPELMKKLPLTDEVKMALSERTGPFALYLETVIAYEQGDLQSCSEYLRRLAIAPETMVQTYFEALAWTDLFETDPVVS